MLAYSEQLIWAPSEDQRAQAGVYIRPTDGEVRPTGIVCIHGARAAFYFPTYVYLGRALAEQGYLFVSGNTRGHDMAVMDSPWASITFGLRAETLADVRLGGDGFARWDEEPADVGGWIDFLVAQGARQVVLFGHSFGADRIAYYQAERQDTRVVGVILASSSDAILATDPARLEIAERLVAEGHGDALLPVPYDDPFAFQSAASLVHWEQHVGRYAPEGHTPWISRIRVPILATLATRELRPNLRPQVEDMQSRAVQAPRFDLHVIDGADHNYTGQERALAHVVLRWLDAL